MDDTLAILSEDELSAVVGLVDAVVRRDRRVTIDSRPTPAGTDVRETRSVTADEARVEHTDGHGSSHRSPRDWWCLGWAWVVIAFIELANAVRDGSRVQLAAGIVTLVLGALWVVRSLWRGGRPWRAHP